MKESRILKQYYRAKVEGAELPFSIDDFIAVEKNDRRGQRKIAFIGGFAQALLIALALALFIHASSTPGAMERGIAEVNERYRVDLRIPRALERFEKSLKQEN